VGRPLWREVGSVVFRFLYPPPSRNRLQLFASSSKLEVTLRLTVGQSICLGIEHHCGTCDQILLPVGMLLSEICGLVSVERPLWRDDGSAICSEITEWFQSRRTRNMEGQVPVFISPRNRVAQLHSRALGSLYSSLTTSRATVEVF
jgi:hypothetical protein